MQGTFGAVAKLEKSTFVTYPALWLFIKNGPTSPTLGAVHMDLEQAKALRDDLDNMIKELL